MKTFIRETALPFLFFIITLLGVLYMAFAIADQNGQMIVIGSIVALVGTALLCFATLDLNKRYTKTVNVFSKVLTLNFTKTI